MNLVVFCMQKSDKNPERKFDLENRLVDFAVNVLALVESLPETKASMYLGGQLLRSATSPALFEPSSNSSRIFSFVSPTVLMSS